MISHAYSKTPKIRPCSSSKPCEDLRVYSGRFYSDTVTEQHRIIQLRRSLALPHTGTNPLLGSHAVSPSPKSTSLALHDPLSPLVLPTNTPLLEEWAGDKRDPLNYLISHSSTSCLCSSAFV